MIQTGIFDREKSSMPTAGFDFTNRPHTRGRGWGKFMAVFSLDSMQGMR